MESAQPSAEVAPSRAHVSTLEAARMLGLAVRSIQLMVDRGDLEAWKTPGGHRRIALDSVDRWRNGERRPPAGIERRRRPATTYASQTGSPPAVRTGSMNATGAKAGTGAVSAVGAAAATTSPEAQRPRVLLIEDSVHFQNMVRLLLGRQFPEIDLEVANDGVAGLVMTGQFQPDVLLVDILLPGIDGATLITSLQGMPQFKDLELIVVTSLDADQLAPYSFALHDLPVVHKPRLIEDLPGWLASSLARRAELRNKASA